MYPFCASHLQLIRMELSYMHWLNPKGEHDYLWRILVLSQCKLVPHLNPNKINWVISSVVFYRILICGANSKVILVHILVDILVGSALQFSLELRKAQSNTIQGSILYIQVDLLEFQTTILMFLFDAGQAFSKGDHRFRFFLKLRRCLST